MVTWGEAYQDYIRSREGELAPRSIQWTEPKVRVHLAELIERPLDQITPRDCRELHERLTRTSGRYSANGCMRIVKAVWNDAERTLDLPRNPVSRGVRLNKEMPAELKVDLDDLSTLWTQVDGLRSGVKRAAWTTLLLTGLRSNDVRTMRWEHLGNDGVLHVPSPKGGRGKAFDLPLCSHLLAELDCLPRDSEWVFSSRNGRKPVSELRQGEVGINPHGCRRLYRTVCAEVGVDLTMAKVLLNHSMGGDISFRYVSKRHLLPAMREAAEKVAGRLVSFRGGGGDRV